MAKYISLDDLLKEIDNLVDKGKYKDVYDRFFQEGINSALYTLKGRINTIEVKEVDLEKLKEELDRVVKIYKPGGDFGWGTLYNIATHFFELGLKAALKGG